MQLPDKYTTAEIKELIDLARNNKDISQEKIAGMEMLVEMLDGFSNKFGMTDAEMKEYGRSAYRVLSKDEALQSKKK